MRVARAVLAALTAFLSLEFLSAHLQQKDQNLGSGDAGQKRRQPHIIFILIDDQGFNDIGYHNPTIKTPTLDKLAAEGVILENYYVQPICTPSRSQLMTGRYQIHTGLQHSIIRPSQPSCLPSNMDTLPERLREAGYSTHMVGKWHLGFYRKSCLPTRKGFDSFFGSLTGSVDYYSYGSCDGAALCGYDLHDNENVALGYEGKYSTILFTQRARKILESHDPMERPLFLLLSLQAVHTPLQPPKSYIYPYRDMTNVARRKYAAMVSTVDEAVRNVTYALKKYGFYKNSVIVYSTDNGAQPLNGGSNWPLRGLKGTYWEGGVRGVAFVHSPLLKRRRRVSRDLLHITDWFPTLVGLGGGDISQSRGLDGFDVWPSISEGKASPRQEILHNINPLHRPTISSISWDDTKSKKAAGKMSKKATIKKKSKQRKRVLKMKQYKKSLFNLKNFRKHLKKSLNPAGKPNKSKPSPKLKPKPKTRAQARHQDQLRYGPKIQSSGSSSVSGSSRQKPKTKSKRTTFQNQNLSQSRQTRTKSKTTKSKSRQTLIQNHNMSQSRTPTPKSQSRLGSTSSSVWDTSVQAAIRVGDWKLLTGDPGHGDWYPLQVLPTLLGRWSVLERSLSSPKTTWLFNITADPFERQDLSDRRPDVVQKLLARLAFYNQTAVPVYFPPDDPRADPGRHEGAWVPWADEEEEEEKYRGVYKKDQGRKKKKKRCPLCKLRTHFLNLNTGMMSNWI